MRPLNCVFRPGCVLLFAFCLCLPVIGHADQLKEGEASSIGDVDFRADCTEEARKAFDRALAMMHHMMYVKARGMFEDITRSHPDCGMAYWGVATTLFQPLWATRPDDEALERGLELSGKAAEYSEGERERHLIEATVAFFEGAQAGDVWVGLDRWVDAMIPAYEAYPEDHDIAALYGLSLLTRAQRVDDPDPLYDEAEAVLREVFEQSPDHPGAIHYTIHATDVDGRAENALDMVERYSEIAPDVPHALHMPSHIYVRLGDWPEVIAWNRRSADVVLDQFEESPISFHYIHAMDYLVYAHLQRGEDQKALAAYEEAMEFERHEPGFPAAFHIAAMPARLAVEQRRWEDAMELEPRNADNQPWDAATWAEGLTWYARGLGAVHAGQLDQARQAEQRLSELRKNAIEADDRAFANYIEVDRLILDGWLAYAEDREDDAVANMREAAELESRIEKHPVTPGALLPPNEALGELLAALGRPDEAVEAFETADAIWPGRYRTLLGAARAASEAGDEDKARYYYGRLRELAEESDREALTEAERFLEDGELRAGAY